MYENEIDISSNFLDCYALTYPSYVNIWTLDWLDEPHTFFKRAGSLSFN